MTGRVKKKTDAAPSAKRLARGFVQTGSALGNSVRRAGEKRGFAEARLLTQWTEVAGPTVAAIARPVKLSYGQGGLGATLTLLTTGANGPMLQMQLPEIIERVNACYGYNAIRKIRITQTAATGFAEDGPQFEHKPDRDLQPISAQQQQAIDVQVGDVADAGLKQALSRLGTNIATRKKNK